MCALLETIRQPSFTQNKRIILLCLLYGRSSELKLRSNQVSDLIKTCENERLHKVFT